MNGLLASGELILSTGAYPVAHGVASDTVGHASTFFRSDTATPVGESALHACDEPMPERQLRAAIVRRALDATEGWTRTGLARPTSTASPLTDSSDASPST